MTDKVIYNTIANKYRKWNFTRKNAEDRKIKIKYY